MWEVSSMEHYKAIKCYCNNNNNKKNLWYIYTVEWILPSKKIQKKLLPFAKAWMELEGIMLGEIKQAVKEKEHMISLISET